MKITRLLLTTLCLLLVAGWLGACSDDDDPVKPADNDTNAPEVIATLPVDGTGGVGIDSGIAIIFSEAMDQDSDAGNITLSAGTVTGTSWYTDRILEIDHSTFPEDTEVTVTLGTGFKDADGNALAEPYALQFLTDGPNLVLMEATPAEGATGVPTNAGIVLRFTDYVSTSEIESEVILTDVLITKNNVPDKTNFTFTVEYMGNNTYLLTPDAPLPDDTVIWVWIPSSLETSGSETLVDSILYSFTTGSSADTTPPTVVSVDPANGRTNVPADQGYIRITFSEPINDEDLTEPDRYNYGFVAGVWFSGVPIWTWNEDFTVLTMPLAADLPAGAHVEFSWNEIEDMTGVRQTTPFNYAIKIAGSPDYLPFVHETKHMIDVEMEEGVIGNTMPTVSDYYSMYIEIDFQPDDSFREIEYTSGSFGTMTGAWQAYREGASAFQWLGWEEESGIILLKSNDFTPPLTVLPLPPAAGTWTDAASIEVEGEGTFTGTLSGTVLPRQDYEIPESKGRAYVRNAWIAVYDIEAELGEELAHTMADTVVYAPGFGPVKHWRYEENLGENEWRLENKWRWPWSDMMMGPKADGHASSPWSPQD